MHKRFEGNLYYIVKEPQLEWDDIGGYPDVKAQLKEMACLPLTERKKLQKMQITCPKGIMMWGPLGVGITMLAEAAAKEAGVPFIYVSGQEMLGKDYEVSMAFNDARAHAPCVMFISDIEWLVPRAGCDYSWSPGNERGIPPTFADKGLTETFIRELDALLAERDDVVILGSCYRIDTVDQAVIKEKVRFNRKIFVPPPRATDRLGILKIYAARLPLAADVELPQIAEKAVGHTGWDIENLCKRAGLLAIAADQEEVSMAHFVAALSYINPWLSPDMTAKYLKLYADDCPHHYSF